MVAVESVMMPLGTKAPEFKLPNVVTGENIELNTVLGQHKGVLVMFICAHCPFVIHIQQQLAQLGRDYHNKSLGIVAISANDAEAYPGDSPENLALMANQLSLTFPLCYDESQSVAKAYQAACTPDFFLFDAALKLVYRGQLDDSRPSNDRPVTGQDLRAAIEQLLGDQPPLENQKPSIGCNIKWKS